MSNSPPRGDCSSTGPRRPPSRSSSPRTPGVGWVRAALVPAVPGAHAGLRGRASRVARQRLPVSNGLTPHQRQDIAKGAWRRLGDIARAAKDLRSVERFYTNAEAWQELGDACVEMKAFDRAVTHYSASGNWSVVLAGAERCMAAGREREAIQLLEAQKAHVLKEGGVGNRKETVSQPRPSAGTVLAQRPAGGCG